MLEHGATTLWERWEGGAGGEMNSHNHPMHGGYQSWLYERLAGLRLAEDACGGDRLIVIPRPGLGVTRCSASLVTPHGRVAITWHVADGRFSGELVVPPGCTATVKLPDGSVQTCRGGSFSLSCTGL